MYVITFEQFNEFINCSFDNQVLDRCISEELFVTIYDRLLDFYLYSPEERHVRLMKKLPMKEIASFIGISGEALSRIRKRLLL